MTSFAAAADSSLHGNTAPASGGDQSRSEFAALVSGCGIYDLSGRAKLAVMGGDRVRWLNGMISNNVRDLQAGQGVYAFLLNAQGRIQADLYTFQRGESLLIDAESTQREKILQLFDRYIIADDVEIADKTDKTSAIGLTGPQSKAVFEDAGIAVPELAALQFVELRWKETPITVLRSGEESGESWQIWIDAANGKQELWQELTSKAAKPVGGDALNMFRVSRGIPQFGVDIRDRDLPQETGQTRALNFTKGCYLGQEIVERIRSRGAVHRQFVAFDVAGSLPVAGTKIVAGEKEVGEITSGAILSFHEGDRCVALGYLRREAAGKELLAGDSKLSPTPVPITGPVSKDLRESTNSAEQN